ncbi:MAG: DUF1801 domain-containing protein [Steroidobacteraceae bacterium]
MKNPAVDAYIAKSADFARPILKRVRALMHQACPKVEETIKWGVPHIEYQGVIAGMTELSTQWVNCRPTQRRLARAIEWMADGKSRNWKYRNC